MIEVPRTTTSTTFEDVLRAMVVEAPPRSTPRLVCAVAGIIGAETSYTSINNWNLGNVMAGATWTGDAWPHPAPQPGQPTHFRAYPSLNAGAADLWRILGADRYRGALTLGRGGAWRAFGLELERAGYVAGLTARQAEGYADDVRAYALRARATFVGSARGGVNLAAAGLVVSGAVGFVAFEYAIRNKRPTPRDPNPATAAIAAGVALALVNNL